MRNITPYKCIDNFVEILKKFGIKLKIHNEKNESNDLEYQGLQDILNF